MLSIWRPQAIGKALLVTLGGIVALLSLPVTAMADLVDFTLGPGFVFALACELWLAVIFSIRSFVGVRLRRNRRERLGRGLCCPGCRPVKRRAALTSPQLSQGGATLPFDSVQQ